MNILSTPQFMRGIKALRKKYPSVIADLEQLKEDLQEDPQQGDPLGKNCYKVRFAIASKKTGKRDSSRLITCVRIEKDTIHLLDVYDKAERSTVSDKELEALLKQIEE
jgi:mRNA-degrading endonuclease RelE of RelBE toxin-antitoxin system